MRICKAVAATVALLLPTLGFAQSKHIHEEVDPYTHLRTLYLEDVSTRACPDDRPIGDHDPDVRLIFVASERSGQATEFFLTTDLSYGAPLYLRTGDRMDSLMDEGVGYFVAAAPSRVNTAYSGGRSYVHEAIPFHVERTNLEVLSHTQVFQFRIDGPRGEVQRCTDARRLHDLSEFLAAAAEYDSAVPAMPLPAPVSSPRLHSVPAPQITESSAQVKEFSVAGIGTYGCTSDANRDLQDPKVQLNITAEQRPDHTVKYFIVADLEHGAPLNLRSKDTLNLTFDGASQSFHTPHGSVIDTVTGSNGRFVQRETIAFHVDRRDIVALSKTSDVQLQIGNSTQSVKRCTDAAHLQQLTSFIDTTASLYVHPVGMSQSH